MATKEISVNNNRKKKIYATAICDIFDKKKTVKYLQFFSTGAQEVNLMNVWVATEKNENR